MLAAHSHSRSQSDIPASPSKHRGRPSISSSISWLSRASTPNILPRNPAGSALKISDPKLVHDLDAFTQVPPRMTPLGHGAVVVGTPQDALVRSFAAQQSLPEEIEESDIYMQLDPAPPSPREEEPSSAPAQQHRFSPLLSRPVNLRTSHSSGNSSRRHSLSTPPSPASSRDFQPPPVRAIPDEILGPIPPFNAVLLAPMPDGQPDLAQTVIKIETATQTHKTTLATLTSKPSHLSRYLLALLSHQSESTSAPNSPFSPHFSALFRDPATSAALASQQIPHIFLDRPSSP